MSWLNLLLNFEDQLGNLVITYGVSIYWILILVIFLESALIIFPFLPGDTLLFVLGAFAAANIFNVFILFFVLSLAAILGNIINYLIGKYFAEFFLSNGRFIDKDDIEKTKEFYTKHGGKTILISRFIPIIRSLAPFVAGATNMNYSKFLTYNILGGILWIGLFLAGGYYLGSIEFIHKNLTVIVLIVIALSLIIPVALKFLRKKTRQVAQVIKEEIPVGDILKN